VYVLVMLANWTWIRLLCKYFIFSAGVSSAKVV